MEMIVAGVLALAVLLAGLLLLERRTARQYANALAGMTERARIQAAKLDAILTDMPDGIMVVDSNLRLQEWNERFPEFAGVPRDMLRVGLDVADILRAQALAGEFGPVEIEAEVARRLILLQSGVSVGTIERTRPGGRTLELRRSPLSSGGFVTLYTDISARRQAESQLRQAQKMEAVGHLTGGVAHDFNNLLMVILGNLDLAQRSLRKSDLVQTHCRIETAQGGAQRAAILTQRLLAFARRQSLEPQSVDVNKAVSNMSELIRHTIGNSIELETVQAGGLWEGAIDPHQLESAVLNLVINARDAMADGGRVTIETANVYLDEAYAANHIEVTPGQYVLVAVSDGGTGMTPQEQARAFEPFFTTKGVGRGSGLGLSQVFGFIKQSKGHVKIYSELGAGTTVKLYLPRVSVESPSVTDTGAPEPELRRARGHETVLVVEDDEDVLAYSLSALRTLGYHAIGAKDASSALTALQRHPDVILLFTDVELPGLNGQKLAEEAKRLRPDLAILYTTGYTTNAVVHRNILNREAGCLNKPFTRAELATTVRKVIDNRTVVAPRRIGPTATISPGRVSGRQATPATRSGASGEERDDE